MSKEKMNPDADRKIVTSRIINARRELVFAAWTDPKQVVQWWGPNGFTNTILEMNVKPGGEWRFIMHGPDGRDYVNKIVYIEVVKPERLVYIHSGDEDTKHLSFHVTVTFEKQGDKTLLTMNSTFESAEMRDKVVKEHGAIEGGNQTLAKLEEYLKQLVVSSQ